MEQIPIIGPNGKPILYAYLDGEDLRFQFEYYGRNENEGDYEVIRTVEPAEFSAIALKFGLDPKNEILANVQKITDLGLGPKLEKALAKKEIKNELFTWMS